MKLGKFFFAATAAVALASCTNDEPIITGPEVTPNPADGYIAVAINLPTQITSRTIENDNYDDGRADEYAVDNGALLLFTAGADKGEADATFHSAYVLSGFNKVDDADKDNISASYIKVVEVSNIPSTGKLYGLVLLNYEGVGAVEGKTFKLTDTGANVSNLASLTGTESVKAFYSGKNNNASHFFMANAPLSLQKGGTQFTKAPSINDVFTLVELTKSIKATEQEAKDAPAGSFYVERAVAKATITFAAGAFSGKDKDGETYSLTVTDKKWALTNTEASSYIVRNMGTGDYMGYRANNNYRMAGTVNLGETSIQPYASPELFRTYFCIDPKFSTPKTFQETAIADFVGVDQAEYCYENTFNVTNMTPANTTAAVIAVTFDNGVKGQNNFWTLNNDRETIYTSIDDAASTAKVYVCNSKVIKDAISAVLPTNTEKYYTGDEIDKFLRITWKRDDETGLLSIDKIDMDQYDIMTGAPVVDQTGIETLNAEMKGTYRIAEYVNGTSYYTVLIQHFGDSLTPWEIEATNTPTTEESYSSDSEKYLGRYGMVRNNWYELSIGSILKIGSPVVPNIEVSTPDDEKKDEKYLAFKINVLSWARRVQDVDLQ